jgi:hypothetical protein
LPFNYYLPKSVGRDAGAAPGFPGIDDDGTAARTSIDEKGDGLILLKALRGSQAITAAGL